MPFVVRIEMSRVRLRSWDRPNSILNPCSRRPWGGPAQGSGQTLRRERPPAPVSGRPGLLLEDGQQALGRPLPRARGADQVRPLPMATGDDSSAISVALA